MNFLIFFIFLFNIDKKFYMDGFIENSLGFKLDNKAIENLKKNIENYPECDFFYVPLIKEKDEDAIKVFFKKSGTEPAILLYLLKNFDIYEEILKKLKIDKIELLKRFLWANHNEKKENLCPFNLNFKKITLKGFQDEISSECYKLFIIYAFEEYQDSIEFSSCMPILKENLLEDLSSLMKRYKIPLLHRHIIQTNNQKIIKKSN